MVNAVYAVKADALAIGRLKADAVAREYQVLGVPGLAVRMETSGTATYYVRYRVKGQAQRRLKIGRVAVTSFKEAREQAIDIVRSAERGEDPYLVKKQSDEGLTFAELWGKRKADNVELAPGTLANYEHALHRYAMKAIGSMKANAVTGDHVRAVLGNIVDKKGKPKIDSWNTTLAAIGSTYAWGRGSAVGITADPTDGIDRKPQAPPRLRNVDESELVRLWQAIGEIRGIEPLTRLAIRVLFLTGQRNSNVSGCRVEWIRPSLGVANPTLVIPAEHMKVKKSPHQVPLVPSVVALFKEAVQLNPGNEFVFASGRSGAGRMSRRTIARAMRKVCVAAKVENVHAHDFRTIVTTFLAERGVSEDVRKKITHHSASGMQAVYNKAVLKEPVRAALQMWADYVEQTTGADRACGVSSKVVPMVSA